MGCAQASEVCREGRRVVQVPVVEGVAGPEVLLDCGQAVHQQRRGAGEAFDDRVVRVGRVLLQVGDVARQQPVVLRVGHVESRLDLAVHMDPHPHQCPG